MSAASSCIPMPPRRPAGCRSTWRRQGVDLMSLSAHKLYGPKGIGALYVRRGLRLAPIFAGGGQERGLRPGTLPTPLCVGFGQACALARQELPDEAARVRVLRDRLYQGLREALPDVRLNGAAAPRLPNNLNLSLPGIDAEDLLAELPELALATGAACASATQEPSPVLRALGLSDEAIAGLDPDRPRAHHHRRRGRVRARSPGRGRAPAQERMRSASRSRAISAIWSRASSNSACAELLRRRSKAARICCAALALDRHDERKAEFSPVLVVQLSKALELCGACIGRGRRSPARRSMRR